MAKKKANKVKKKETSKVKKVKAGPAKTKKRGTKAKPSPSSAPPDPELVLQPKPKKKGSPFAGKTFHITDMEVWGSDYINAEVQAHITLGEDGIGRFQFGFVRGQLDYRETARGDGKTALEWSWEGRDHGGGDDVSGRGWAVLRSDGGLEGRIFLHMGDDSGFGAVVG